MGLTKLVVVEVLLYFGVTQSTYNDANNPLLLFAGEVEALEKTTIKMVSMDRPLMVEGTTVVTPDLVGLAAVLMGKTATVMVVRGATTQVALLRVMTQV